MKKVLFALSAATVLVAGPAAFANPSEEAAGDYVGWKAARDAGIVGFPEDRNRLPNTMPNNVGR